MIIKNLPIGFEKVDKWNGLASDYEPDDLKDIPQKYRAHGCEGKDMRLRSDALESLCLMIKDALKDEIHIHCISAYRSYEYQQGLFDKAIIKHGENQMTTARPGHSEHQLGTTIDITSPEINDGLSESFAETKTYFWIEANANKYCFYFSYTKENHLQKGYIWEPWHLRYWGNQVPG